MHYIYLCMILLYGSCTIGAPLCKVQGRLVLDHMDMPYDVYVQGHVRFSKSHVQSVRVQGVMHALRASFDKKCVIEGVLDARDSRFGIIEFSGKRLRFHHVIADKLYVHASDIPTHIELLNGSKVYAVFFDEEGGKVWRDASSKVQEPVVRGKVQLLVKGDKAHASSKQ